MDSASDASALPDLEFHASDAVRLLKAMANESRLMVLCYLLASGEASVTRLTEAVGLSQSALSQHLAKLRDDGLVTYRREAQTLFYRVSDDRAEPVLAVLKDIFCPDLRPQQDERL